MRPVVRFTLKQTVLFNLLFVLLMAAGAFSLLEVPVERYPQINFGKVIISTFYPSASPRDVEAMVTREIEDAIQGLEDVEFVRSVSAREFSTQVVKFRDDSDYDALFDELRFRVLSITDRFPALVEPPHFTLIRTSDWLPVVAVNLLGERGNRALTLLAEELKVPLGEIPGVQEARVLGEYEREFHIDLDPDQLSHYGITYAQVSAALQAANVSIPAGDFSDTSGEYVVSVDEKFRTREQVVQTVVRRDADGSFVTVGDLISRAEMTYREPNTIISVNGTHGVTIKVLKTEDGNALTILSEVRRVVEEHRARLEAQGVELALTQDSTTYIEESISTLGWNMILGVALVSVLIWYFMGFRNAALTTIGIPFSFLVTMVLMYLTDNSLNEVTLFSFVLVSGIVVDDAIVVIENIYRHVQQGDPLDKAIVNGTSEVMIPVISATATTIAAFLPMLMMTGSTGEFFALIPKAITYAILASLLECLLILPIHYKDYGPKPASGKAIEEHDNAFMALSRRITESVIRITMRFRWTSIGVVVVAFFVSMALFIASVSGAYPFIRIKFFPDDYKIYYAFIEGPPDATMEESDRRVRAISKYIMADGPGYATSAAGFAGFSVNEDYEETYAHNLGTVMVALPNNEQRAFDDPQLHLEQMTARLRAEFERDGYTLTTRAEKDGPPAGKDVNIRVLGSDEQSVRGLAQAMLTALREDPAVAPHLTQLQDDSGNPARVFRLAVDSLRTHEYGLTNADVAGLAAGVLDGSFIGKFRTADEEVDLKLSIDPHKLPSPEAALDIPVIEHASGPVRLGDLVTPEVSYQPGELHRYQQQRSLTLTANLKADTTLSAPAVVAWAKKYYAQIQQDYPGATLTYGGEFESTRRSYTSLGYAFGLAVLVMYLILATQFHSYAQPLIVLSAIVFAVIGVILGKLLTQSLFTVNSFVAIVGVTGVVVNDSLVLIDFMNKRYAEGMNRADAIADAIRVRLRPILLTTLTTSLGLLPMAIGIPSYSVVWGSMASTFVTGLATATLLTLFIVPVQWNLLMGFIERRRRQRGLPAHPAHEVAAPAS